jgi:DNA-binding beta-propeller fold protein YncE
MKKLTPGWGAAAALLVSAATALGPSLAPTASASPAHKMNGPSHPLGRLVASAVAANGDNNPYGMAVVPLTAGKLVSGDLLIADFNDSAGAAGHGTSIVEVNPSTGATTTFASGLPITGPVGIAINPKNDGVWVGDFGATDGSTSNDLLIAPTGAVKAIFDPATTATPVTTGQQPTFDGVWGQGVSATAAGISFYYGTVGSGPTGTGGGEVWRLTPHPTATTSNGQPVNSTYVEVAAGLGDNATSGALPVSAANAAGPQGLAFDDATGTLYVSDDANNTIYALAGAATAMGPVQARVVASGGPVNVPEDIAIDPSNGDLLVANAGDNTLTELDPATGRVVWSKVLDHGASGALFGLAVAPQGPRATAVFYDDDNTNNVYELVLPPSPNQARNERAHHMA